MENHETFKIGYIFFGIHAAVDDLKFDNLRIRYAHFERWLNTTGVNANFGFDEGNVQGTIEFKNINVFEANVQGFDFRIKTYPTYDQREGIHLQEQGVIEAKYNDHLSLTDWYKLFISPLQNFFSYVFDALTYPVDVKVFSSENVVDGKSPDYITVYFRPTRISQSSLDEQTITPLFVYSSVATEFDKHLQSWFSKSEKLRDTVGLYSASVLNPPQFINLQFFLLAQSIEAYHRQIHDGKYLSTKEYKEKVLPHLRASLTGIPELTLQGTDREKFLEVLGSSFSFGNEFSLRKRIMDVLVRVLSQYQEIVEKIVEDPRNFSKVVSDTRNYYTHYVKGSDSKAVTSVVKLYELTMRLKLILQLCIFVELEFSPELINQISETNSEFKKWMRASVTLYEA